MINSLANLRNIFRRPLVKYGMPFFILMIGGSLGLREFSQLRYHFDYLAGTVIANAILPDLKCRYYSKTSLIRPEDAEAFGVKMKKPGEVTLETEYEKIKSLDTENWEMVRGPRPWEENPSEK